jgi:hypothetical protein
MILYDWIYSLNTYGRYDRYDLGMGFFTMSVKILWLAEIH